jgi:hypothetical protein
MVGEGDSSLCCLLLCGSIGFLYSTQAARDIWWSKLNEVMDHERGREPRATNIQLLYYDCATGIEYVSIAQLARIL